MDWCLVETRLMVSFEGNKCPASLVTLSQGHALFVLERLFCRSFAPVRPLHVHHFLPGFSPEPWPLFHLRRAPQMATQFIPMAPRPTPKPRLKHPSAATQIHPHRRVTQQTAFPSELQRQHIVTSPMIRVNCVWRIPFTLLCGADSRSQATIPKLT